MDYLCAKFGGF